MLAGALFVSVLAACGRPCSHEDPILELDGGQAICAQNTQCPRSVDVLVCSQDEDRLRGCVGCTSGRCVRYVPGSCP